MNCVERVEAGRVGKQTDTHTHRQTETNHSQAEGRKKGIRRRNESNLTAIDAWLSKIKDGDKRVVEKGLKVKEEEEEEEMRLASREWRKKKEWERIKIISNQTENQSKIVGQRKKNGLAFWKCWMEKEKKNHSSTERKWADQVLHTHTHDCRPPPPPSVDLEAQFRDMICKFARLICIWPPTGNLQKASIMRRITCQVLKTSLVLDGKFNLPKKRRKKKFVQVTLHKQVECGKWMEEKQKWRKKKIRAGD